MGIEIERRFLTCSSDWQSESTLKQRLVQGYILNQKEKSVRVRIADDEAWLTVKGGTDVLNRSEFEYTVPVDQAQQMLDTLCDGKTIEKVRHLIPTGNLKWEIDVFEGTNAGLVIAEIELPNAETQFEIPSWLGDEITSDSRYLNARLLNTPWSTWDAAST